MNVKLSTCFYLLLFSSFITVTGCGDDEDDVFDPVIELGRFEGWALQSIESNFAARADSVVAAIPEENLQQAGRTRAEVRASFDADIALATEIRDCDRDDALFFAGGAAAVGQAGDRCPEQGDPSILDVFDNQFYSTDRQATRLTIGVGNGATTTNYQVLELSRTNLRLRQDRTVAGNLLVPAFTYTITYNFTAR